MHRTRTLLATLVLLAADVCPAQPPGALAEQPPTTPLVVTLLPYIGDEGVQKELKLTAEQAKRLLAFRQKEWDAEYTTAPKDRKQAAIDKAAETELTAVLGPEQLKRAKQIAAQVAWTQNVFFGGSVRPPLDYFSVPLSALKQYPEEIGSALKLDEAQKKLVATTTGYWFGQSVYLTPAQADAAKELLGPPVAGPMTQQYDTRNNGFGGFNGGPASGPILLRYTAPPDVQKELKLTAEQIAALDDLRKKFPTGPGGGRGAADDLSPAARQKAEDELLAHTTAAMEKILTAGQRTRLDQLSRSGTATGTFFLNGNTLGKQLEITAEQRTAYQAAVKAHDEAVAKAVLADEPVEQVRAKVQALNTAHAEAVEAMLTPAQQARRKDLFGAEFKGQLATRGGYAGGFGIGPDGIPVNIANTREWTFGLYTTQLTQLSSMPGLQAELKLTEEQVKKVRDATQELLTNRPLDRTGGDEALKKSYAARSAFVEKSLSDILDKDQRARFRELFLQQLEARGAPVNPFLAPIGTASYPGVAEAIKLTAGQKKKLLANEKPDDVLTADQKKAIKDMLGKPADLAAVFSRPAFAGGRGARPALPPAYQMLLSTTYWGEIKLTPEQIAKLAPAANEYTAEATRGVPGGWGFGGAGVGGPATATDPAKLKAAVESFTKAIDAILTAGQKKRLGQLALQQRAAASLALVFAMPGSFGSPALPSAPTDVQKELGVTNEQMTKINTLSADATERANLLGRGRGGFVDFQSQTTATAKLRDRLDERVLKELTPAQAAKWKDLLGEPYAGFAKRPIPVGGRGPGGGGPFAP